MAYKRKVEGRIDLMIVDPEGNNPRVLWARDIKGAMDPPGGTTWSSDGKFIATSAMDGFILVSDLSGKVSKLKLSLDGGQIYRLQWLPDSSGLVFVGDSGVAFRRIFLVTYPVGEVKPLTTGTASHDQNSLGVTADGSSIFAVQTIGGTDLWLTTGDFRKSKQLTVHRTDYAFGLDLVGGRIAYMSFSQAKSTVWTMDQDGSNPVQVSPEGIQAGFASLSLDGRRISFQEMVGGNSDIWLGNSDGTDVRQITHGDRDFLPYFTADGKSIIFNEHNGGAPRIMVVPTTGGTPRRLSDRTLVVNSRPCGDWVVARIVEASLFSTYALVSTVDGHIQKIFEVPPSAYNVACMPGSNSVSYTSSPEGSNVWAMPLDGSPVRQITHFDSDTVWNYVWSPDGRGLLVSRGSSFSDAVLIRNFR